MAELGCFASTPLCVYVREARKEGEEEEEDEEEGEEEEGEEGRRVREGGERSLRLLLWKQVPNIYVVN